MKLWLLRPKKEFPEEHFDPWEPWYDKTFGFVIRAETEETARKIADKNATAENDPLRPWLDPLLSDCVELNSKGKEELILQDTWYA